MADDWEDNDWEKEDFNPVLPAVGAAAAAAVEAKPDEPTFEDEDQEAEPETKDYSIKPQPKKKVEKKYEKGEVVDVPLDDPVAEKLRRQRLEEEADFRAARELFGGGSSGGSQLDSLLPKTLKDFEQYAELLTNRYFLPHATNKNYKGLLKAVLRLAMEPLSADDAKEVEHAAAGVRADKLKAAQAAAGAKKTKKTLNVGKSGLSAGLDDYVYEGAAGPDEDYDFM